MVPNSFLGSGGLSESKIADFRPKNRNFWKLFWPKFLHVGVRRAPKIFSELRYPRSISKNFSGFLTQFESRIMKKVTPPKKKTFFCGGGWNEIVEFRQVKREQKEGSFSKLKTSRNRYLAFHMHYLISKRDTVSTFKDLKTPSGCAPQAKIFPVFLLLNPRTPGTIPP